MREKESPQKQKMTFITPIRATLLIINIFRKNLLKSNFRLSKYYSQLF